MEDIQPTPNKLRFYRERAGLLQREVAVALGLDCMDRISRWENGLNMPSVANLFRLAGIYKVTPQELYPELLKKMSVLCVPEAAMDFRSMMAR